MEEEPNKLEITNLPKDIIFDIFARIPLRKLYQLRCICKKWLILLNLDQEFTTFYHKKHKTSPILLFTHQNNETPLTQISKISSYYIDGTKLDHLSTNFNHPLTTILTCNGVLCLISNHKVILYDPIIKRVSTLPNSSHFSSSFCWGFGFSSFRKAFKLIHFYTVEKFDNFHYCKVKEVMCEIVTKSSSQLGMNSQFLEWKFLGKCPYDILGRKHYVVVDGKIYWLVGEKKYNPSCIKIMSFDLETEFFGLVCFPKTYSDRSVECLNLVEIKGKLCLSDRLPWETSVDVWMMMNEDEGFVNCWVKKYRVDLMGVDHHNVKIMGHLTKITTTSKPYSQKNLESANRNRAIGHFIKNDESDDDDDDEYESEGEILIKVGEQSCGLLELKNGEFRDVLLDGIRMEGCNLQVMIDRKNML